MRQDKLTTKFQQALADAQTIALGNDNQIRSFTKENESFFRKQEKKLHNKFQDGGFSRNRPFLCVLYHRKRAVKLLSDVFRNSW